MSGEIRNARIEQTFLGIEDHGLLIMTLYMDYGDSAQGYQRIIQGNGWPQLRDLLTVLHATSWEQLVGTNCRCRIEDGLIRQVGHIVQDDWTQH